MLGRSLFPGAGKYASHWLGDNYSKWEYMQYSISGIMNFNMFGIPHVGADICGFYGNASDDMCGRWMQLSAFYPFARNHYNFTDEEGHVLKPQEAYTLEAPYNNTARNAILQRYSFLRYFYTLLFEVSRNKRGAVIRPLFFEFPDDEKTYQGYEHSFMVGSALKVTPVITLQNSVDNEVKSYFPKNSRFVSLNDFKSIQQGKLFKNFKFFRH